ncbi:MAG: zinc-ribbon domain-containing protein [Myxococcota bacterium]
MIAGCPRCSARYRIARERIRPEGVRLRCQRCQAAFRVRAPSVASPRPALGESEVPRSAPERERLVVLADPDPERAKATAAVLGAAGLEVVLAHDGVEAILTVQRVLPRAVILDASLPRMFGFQVCELMKRNESLRTIGVLLVGSVHRPERYRRPPGDLYGADAYLEEPGVAEAALAALREMGLPLAVAPTPEPRLSEPAPPTPEPRASEPRQPGVPDEAVAKAERLARIIVSDIVLYNQEKFTTAVAAGNVLESLDTELEEGRSLFRERVEAGVREARDFLGEEVLRVARARGMK